jgi:hypothetical protein
MPKQHDGIQQVQIEPTVKQNGSDAATQPVKPLMAGTWPSQ